MHSKSWPESSQRVKFAIKYTEAQHNRRFLLQRRTEEQRKGNGHQLPSMLGGALPVGLAACDAVSGRRNRTVRLCGVELEVLALVRLWSSHSQRSVIWVTEDARDGEEAS